MKCAHVYTQPSLSIPRPPPRFLSLPRPRRRRRQPPPPFSPPLRHPDPSSAVPGPGSWTESQTCHRLRGRGVRRVGRLRGGPHVLGSGGRELAAMPPGPSVARCGAGRPFQGGCLVGGLSTLSARLAPPRRSEHGAGRSVGVVRKSLAVETAQKLWSKRNSSTSGLFCILHLSAGRTPLHTLTRQTHTTYCTHMQSLLSPRTTANTTLKEVSQEKIRNPLALITKPPSNHNTRHARHGTSTHPPLLPLKTSSQP